MSLAGVLPPLLLLLPAAAGGPWAAWMPPSIAGLEGTCVLLPCRFDYPEELRPAAVHGLWYFGSPYPKSYPPAARDCSLLLTGLSPELAGRYYFRGDLGGYNQYSFSEHATLEVTGERGTGGGSRGGGPVGLEVPWRRRSTRGEVPRGRRSAMEKVPWGRRSHGGGSPMGEKIHDGGCPMGEKIHDGGGPMGEEVPWGRSRGGEDP
nr:myelin-associated glycoprotein-like isoform X2 [Dromaius novaehollandiae]